MQHFINLFRFCLFKENENKSPMESPLPHNKKSESEENQRTPLPKDCPSKINKRLCFKIPLVEYSDDKKNKKRKKVHFKGNNNGAPLKSILKPHRCLTPKPQSAPITLYSDDEGTGITTCMD